MARIYRPRHPEQTVLYQVLFHYFDRFLAEYEERFEKAYGYFRPIIKEVVEGEERPRRLIIYLETRFQDTQGKSLRGKTEGKALREKEKIYANLINS